MTPPSAGPHGLDGHLPGSGPWILGMRWSDLLFAHWRIPSQQARALVPPPLEPDLLDGSGWLAVVPFLMSRVRPRLVPPISPISRFPEINVRTYATYGGRRGVWFLSLDAAGRVGVTVGRHVAGLPYQLARMSLATDRDGWTEVWSVRRERDQPPATLDARYRPVGPVRPPTELDAFLTERDGLWTLGRDGRPRWLAIRHRAWPLQDAEAEFRAQTLTDAAGLTLSRPPDHLAFSGTIDVEAWRPMRPVSASP